MDLSLPVPDVSHGDTAIPIPTRIATARSILDHRAPTSDTATLAILALLGLDVIAQAGC
jgi:hypothetical protein